MAATQVVLVGGAHIHTPSFVKKLSERQDIGVAGVWDPDADRAKRRAEALGCPVVDRLDDLLALLDVSAAVVCTETNRHLDVVLPIVSAGKHVFVEKPLGFAAADARVMKSAIERAGVIFQTGFFMRSQPAYRWLKTQIDAGLFGRITRVRHSNCHKGSLGGWFDTEWRWMADPTIAGCGAFGDLGAHSLDLLIWLMGPVRKATATVTTVTGRYGLCDETGEGTLVFANGAIGTIAAGWLDLTNPVTFELSGLDGQAYILNGKLYVHAPKFPDPAGRPIAAEAPWTDLPAPLPHAFDLFLDRITGKQADLIPVEQVAHGSVVMDAMYRGSATGSWVQI